MAAKVSPTQMEVLRRLDSHPTGRIVREPGGFWTTPLCPRGTYCGGTAPEWNVNIQTVRAMERAGLLEVASAGPEWLADRKITDAGRAVARQGGGA